MTELVKEECEIGYESEGTEPINHVSSTKECEVCLTTQSCTDMSVRGSWWKEYVEQHLNLKLDLTYVCHRCWGMVDEFHEFYEMVHRHHRINNNIHEQSISMEASKIKTSTALLCNEPERILSMEFVEIKTEPVESSLSVKEEEEPLNVLPKSCTAENISTRAVEMKVEEDTKSSDDDDADSVFSKEDSGDNLPRTVRTKKRTNIGNTKAKREPKIDHSILEFYKRLVCEVCDPEKMMTGEPSIEYNNLKDLNRHMRKSHGQTMGNIKCPICDKKFRSRVKLLEHKDMHLDPDRFRCEVCQEVHQNMEEHMKNKHQEKTYCCEECGKRFPFKSRLTAHVRKMHTVKDVVCDQCQKRFSKYTIEDHKRAVHGSSFMCEHCPRTFKTRVPLEQHMEEHIEGLRRAAAATCNICGIVVRNKYTLSAHIKRIHTEHVPVSCGSCGKVFKSKRNLNAHLTNVCTDRSFPCSICGKQFKKKIKMIEHMTTHTKSALYQCQFCPKKFSFETQLYTHRKQAHYEQWLELQRKRKAGERFKVNRIAD